jgi:polyhydroxyalkanoate synthesis regulator phasin
VDGLKGYVALVSGLTEATAAKAREVATALLAQGGIQGVPSGAAAMATQITGLAEDLLVTARDNRGALLEVVRTEAERAVATLGVVTAAEAEALRRRIAELENELAQLRASAAAAPSAAPVTRVPRTPAASTAPPPSPATVQKAVAKKAAAKKATAKKATAKKTTAKKATAKKTTAKKATAKKATATKAVPGTEVP